MLWRDTMGIPVVLLGAVGVIWMLAHAGSGGAAAGLPHSVPCVHQSHRSGDAVPESGAAIRRGICGVGVDALAERISGRRWLFWGAVVVCALPALVGSIRADLFFRRADTRTLAREYIERTIPAGSAVLVQPYSAPLTLSREALVEALTRHVGSPAAASTKFQLQLSLDPYPSPAYRSSTSAVAVSTSTSTSIRPTSAA